MRKAIVVLGVVLLAGCGRVPTEPAEVVVTGADVLVCAPPKVAGFVRVVFGPYTLADGSVVKADTLMKPVCLTVP